MITPRTFARKLQWSIGLTMCVVLGVTSWLNYNASRRIIEEQTEAEALQRVKAAAVDLDDVIRRVGMLPIAIAAPLGESDGLVKNEIRSAPETGRTKPKMS